MIQLHSHLTFNNLFLHYLPHSVSFALLLVSRRITYNDFGLKYFCICYQFTMHTCNSIHSPLNIIFFTIVSYWELNVKVCIYGKYTTRCTATWLFFFLYILFAIHISLVCHCWAFRFKMQSTFTAFAISLTILSFSFRDADLLLNLPHG